MRTGRWTGRAAIMALAAAMAGSAGAHHALEFVETESTTTLERGQKLFYLRYDIMAPDRDDASQDRWEITPGLALGLTDRLLFDAHLHYARFGAGHIVEGAVEEMGPQGPPPFFEAVALTLAYRFTPENAPVQMAVAASVELPFRRAVDLLDAEEVYGGTLILSREFGHHANLSLNLTVEHEGGDTEFGYALGFRRAIGADPHGIAAGIELLGDFEDIADSWRLTPGVYLPLDAGRTLLKAGFGIGRNAESTRATVMLVHVF